MSIKMTEEQQDVLTEIVNIGAGKAAKHLSLLLNDTVRMSVPKVILGDMDELATFLHMSMSEVMVGIEQQASGLLNAKITFLFYSNNSASLAQALVGDHPLTLIGTDLRALQYDAITEIGNIVVTSCVKSLSDLLKGAIQLSLPTYQEGPLNELFFNDVKTPKKSMGILVMHTEIKAELRNVSGALIIAITQADISLLITSIDRWIEELKLA